MVLAAARQVRIVALFVWLAGSVFLASQDKLAGQDKPDKKDQINHCIRELDSPEFLTR